MHIQSGILAVLAVSALAACARPAVETPEFWDCDLLEFAAFPANGALHLHLPGYEETLDAADADGNRRYAHGAIRLRYTDDGGVVLDIDGARHACEPKAWEGPWDAARERGAVFRAIGQEPGWHVEVIPDGNLTLALDYGERTLALPTPPVTALDEGARGYQGHDAEGRLVLVVIEPLTCFDIMSGEVFPETVTVAVDDERYRGCGLPL